MNSGLVLGLSLYPHMWKPQDFVLGPIFFILIYLIGRLLKKRHTCTKPWTRKYFMPALVLRMLGCVLSIWMYDFYYGGSDMTVYYHASSEFASLLLNNPEYFLEVLFYPPSKLSPELLDIFYDSGTSQYLKTNSTLLVVRIGGLLYLLSFGSIYGIGLMLSFFSFWGCWKLFETFQNKYPHLHKHLAYATLFIPSVLFWGGAGLMKDTIVLGLVGYLVHSVYKIFVTRKRNFVQLIIMVVSVICIFIIKSYVALSLVPVIILWIVLERHQTIRNKLLKKITKPILLGSGVLLSVVALISLSSQADSNYSLSGILDYTKSFQEYSLDRTIMAGGVGYDLGEYESSVSGLISVFPKSVGATLFRPYLWETKKAILIPGALESLMTFIITIIVVFRVGLFRSFSRIWANPTLFFCFGFSLLFSFAIGFTSFNFGTLARYKIIALPFYFIGLSILYASRRKKPSLIMPQSG